MDNLDVLLVRIARGKNERCEVGTWLAQCYCEALTGLLPVGRLVHGLIDGEPTPAARNSAVLAAREGKFDVLLMCDNDMLPSPTFFRHALEFLAARPGQSVAIGSPYCGGPPDRLVQVCRRDGRRVERHHAVAALRAGDEIVQAIGTGLLACSLTAFATAPEPWFDYEYTDARKHTVKTTEDFFFCRRLTQAGGRVYCAWDHWSGHAKTELVGKPE